MRNGGYRNHCPFCLYSLHVDRRPGDRASHCRALMEPIALEYRPSKGYVVVHRCLRCGFVRPNRVATDPEQPDDLEAIIRLMERQQARGGAR